MTTPRLQAMADKAKDSKAPAPTDRRWEKGCLHTGQRITYAGFSGTVARLYADGPYESARMYEIHLPGGIACVCGSDITPQE